MNFFSAIPDGQVIVHCRGVYRQVPAYECSLTMGEGKSAKTLRAIYAKYGSGFVRLSTSGATSATNVRWSEVDAGGGSFREIGGFVEYLPGETAMMEAAE